MKSFSESLGNLSVSLEREHGSMSVDRNPVLSNVQNFSASELEVILGQYTLLPLKIVEFLRAGADRLEQWTDVKGELDRNIAEEKGSRTDGLSHYSILESALLRELKLDVSKIEASASTNRFLKLVGTGLANQPNAFVAGILYGLEASAVPELTIVAMLINDYADSIGLTPPIKAECLTGRVAKREEDTISGDKYSLNVFFAAHLWDFEVGHRAGLEKSLVKYLDTSDDISDFEAGFEYVLDAMDCWWESLAYADESALHRNSDFTVEEQEQGNVLMSS